MEKLLDEKGVLGRGVIVEQVVEALGQALDAFFAKNMVQIAGKA